ncbi:hypothetical protein DF143_01910 [Burkholderia cenocepacia]|nr:hypothetical protein DF143_01910 [Burkholderia cenocepacia]RQV50616.1 hypothetical protein DF033_01915 [Burkholderia cenocepacia]HDR9876196.1 hypothetical protein [Burkholderia cenocepacia]HDR9883265.1 hypothetical protein [Burkholderia cenocepacia]
MALLEPTLQVTLVHRGLHVFSISSCPAPPAPPSGERGRRRRRRVQGHLQPRPHGFLWLLLCRVARRARSCVAPGGAPRAQGFSSFLKYDR